MSAKAPDAGGATEPAAAKRTLRRSARAVRASAAAADTAAGQRAAAALCAQFLSAFAPGPGTVVSGYWPMADEIDPRPLLQALGEAGCRLTLPALAGKGRPLEFRVWAPGDTLLPAALGTQEPLPEKPVFEPQVLLVPLLAFDGEGYRLGYGGGFYDRSLALLRGRSDILAVGVAYAAQQVAAVPHDGNDQRLDAVVTEAAVLRFGPPSP
ncbi:5-formyltetrahydrofolate cyclo-ligase [Pelagibius sp.]|uniref:5-formyltetrahydrofolate cyclo-ligase n=1 Tax=Pelagibius sp. TaxID=1931238 RepID=UPI0026330170|nr:5-formyltetrahydrofolate cyclo-ligase [Pelagibius sp.]